MGEIVIPDHKLVRCIAEGAYGEVWLIQSINGSWRAVKIIHYRKFKNPRPFEREYNGVKEYELISREHEHLVDVLHVGRNDGESYFYYIMELADNLGYDEEQRIPGASQSECQSQKITGRESFDVESYQPHTLENQLKLSKRLPLKECVQVGIAIAKALDFLHAHGLVHRDVKPSNILRVNGVYKLADVGLVTHTYSAHSYVGTEGYVPPEGPGSTSADIYALGKVLYEIVTGNDRMDFPVLPALTFDSDESALLVELNYIILRACHDNPSKRYSCAAEMVKDLEYIAAGGSIRRLKSKIKRVRTALTAFACLLIGLACCGLYYNYNSGIVLISSISLPGGVNCYNTVFTQAGRDRPQKIVHYGDEFLTVLDHSGNIITRHPVFPAGTKDIDINMVKDIDDDGVEVFFIGSMDGSNAVLQAVSLRDLRL